MQDLRDTPSHQSHAQIYSPPGRLRSLNAALAGAIATVTVTTLLVGWLKSQTDVVEVSSVYLLSVLALGSVAGRPSAILAALLSFLTVNFFFVEPIFTLHVANPREWLTLTILLVTALISGQLTAALRDRAQEAERRRAEISFLYELGQLLGERRPLKDRIGEGLTWLAEARGLRLNDLGVALMDGNVVRPDGVPPLGGVSPELPKDVTDALDAGDIATTTWRFSAQHIRQFERDVRMSVLPKTDTVWVPLMVSGKRVGALSLDRCNVLNVYRPDWRAFVLAVAALLAQTIERDRLGVVATEAEILQRADGMKSALLSSVSHDLRTPLASIKASVTALLDKGARLKADERTELLEGVSEETDRLTRFVSHLLELSRLESGAAAPHAEWYEASEIVWEVADALDPTGKRLQIDIPDSAALVRADFVMVVQILTNLVDNALRYSPKEAPVKIGVTQGPKFWRVQVMDRGPGVPGRDRERIFEKFYRSGQQDGVRSGAGVGLAVARGLAQAHGGDVRYEPRPGGGSTFVLELPMAEPSVDVAS